jgi:hypothetical protein
VATTCPLMSACSGPVVGEEDELLRMISCITTQLSCDQIDGSIMRTSAVLILGLGAVC